VIERLLAAESALARDELEVAERHFNLVADADPRNAIAVVGLARIAARRGDPEAARGLARRALEIDPDEAAAARLLGELDLPEPPEPSAIDPTKAAPWWRRWLNRLRGRG
jgi:tetratricopeptide (TPR) repeat protein